MKHSPSSFSIILQVGAIMLATLLVVWIFFRIRPTMLPALTLQESIHTTLETLSGATAILTEDQRVIGSGVLIDSSLLLTSKHLVQIGKTYDVRFSDTHTVKWVPIGLHPDLDLALLVLEKAQANSVPIITSQALVSPGDFVIATGAITSQWSLIHNLGIISATDTFLNVWGKILSWLMLTDIAFHAGYSGGAVVNIRGELIGINSAYVSESGAGWSTPVDASLIAQWRETLQ
jgi:S1-C subfamily serine protease